MRHGPVRGGFRRAMNDDLRMGNELRRVDFLKDPDNGLSRIGKDGKRLGGKRFLKPWARHNERPEKGGEDESMQGSSDHGGGCYTGSEGPVYEVEVEDKRGRWTARAGKRIMRVGRSCGARGGGGKRKKADFRLDTWLRRR